MAQGGFTPPEHLKMAGFPKQRFPLFGAGGKPDSAMGGDSDVSKLDNALACVDDFVSQKLGL